MKKFLTSLFYLLILPAVCFAQDDKMLETAWHENSSASAEHKIVQDDIGAKIMRSTEMQVAKRNGVSLKSVVMVGAAQNDSAMTLNSARKWREGSIATLQRSKTANVRKAAATLTSGYFIAKDHVVGGDDVNSSMKLILQSGAYKMQNVYGVNNATIKLTVDLEAGTVSIAPQKLYRHSTYGNVFLYAVDPVEGTYDSKADITGTIEADGSIHLNAWGLFVSTGKYKGACFNVFESSDWMPANATIENVDSKGNTTSYGALIEQPYDNELKIYSFANNGTAVSARIDASKQIKIAPQYILTNSMYGDFYCYPCDIESGKIFMTKSIAGTYDNGTISIGNWIVAMKGSAAKATMLNQSTTISTTFDIKFPSQLTASFEGEGTKASPYLIKSAQDLFVLSESVADGNGYEGNYFELAADVDMSALTSRFSPIGNEETPFYGHFDGKGKTISNLAIKRDGLNCAGLFGYVGNGGAVSNVTLKDINVTAAAMYTGGVVGYSEAPISACSATGTVTSVGAVAGGVVGMTTASISDCSFEGKVNGYGGNGGVAGEVFNAPATRCHANATITVSGKVNDLYTQMGGVFGIYITQDSCKNNTVTDCYFSGQVNDNYGTGFSGGVAGLVSHVRMSRCYNVGLLTSVNNRSDGTDAGCGGLMGYCTTSQINDCYNAGTIVRRNKSERAGGLAGWLSVSYINGKEVKGMSYFTNCYNSGYVMSTSTAKTKGLYGETFPLNGYDPAVDMFNNCYFDGQINGVADATYSKPTAWFTSATLPEGFAADVWTAHAGQYPVITSLAGTDAANLSAACMTLANNETTHKVKSDFALSQTNGIEWKMFTEDGFADETQGVKIDGSKGQIKTSYANDMIVAIATKESDVKYCSLAIVPKVFEGEGTEKSPYLIKSIDDFKMLNTAVRTYAQPHEGDFFKMANDIDFNYDESFAGVGADSTNVFGGVFDGDGHTIHKLKIHAVAYSARGTILAKGSYNNAGLFNICSATSVIKNVNIGADCDFIFYGLSAPLVGYTSGRVENCANYADVNGAQSYIGGLVGRSTGTISKCYNAGNVLSGNNCAGGIVSATQGLVELCQNDGNVTAAFYNDAVKDGSQAQAAGITAECYGTIDRCSNNGMVSSYNTVGGIVATLTNSTGHGNITHCVNTGLVNCFNTTNSRGGIIAKMYGKGEVSGNYYDASINTNGGAANAAMNGITPVTTAQLVAGTALAGLNAADWAYAEHAYPVLAAFAEQPKAKALRSIYVIFGDKESRTNLGKTVALADNQLIKWSLKGGSESYTIDGTTLRVTPPTTDIVATDTLVAVYNGLYEKALELKCLPENLFAGKGTADNPYIISNVADMTHLATFMDETKTEFDGYHFLLANDLDYTDQEYTPVALGSVYFQGTFDGNGKTVSNFSVIRDENSNGQHIGFFGNIGSNGTVCNLTLNGAIKGYSDVGGFASRLYGKLLNCVNKSDLMSVGYSQLGGLVGEAFEGAVIKNCHNEGIIRSSENLVAGLVGEMNEGTTLEDCYNTGKVTSSGNSVAGLVANANGVMIKNCYNTGAVSGSQKVAGLIAYSAGSDTIVNCHNTGNVTAEKNIAGGLIATTGTKAKAWVEHCYNTGAVTGTATIAGVIGEQKSGHHFENCYNEGDVTSTSGEDIGGFVGSGSGSADYDTDIVNCHNTGNVTSTDGDTGGFAGDMSDGVTMRNCYNTGNVEATNSESLIRSVGGFAGSIGGKAVGCWNAGNVVSSGIALGGIAGLGAGEVDSCFNIGNITSRMAEFSSHGCVGGIWGYGRPKIHNCYNAGTLTGPTGISGINGEAYSASVIDNCYNAGRIVTTMAGQQDECGNITYCNGGLESLDEITVTNCYFDKTVNAESHAMDVMATGLTTAEMYEAQLGDAYVLNRACYPVLAGNETNILAMFAAVGVAYTGNDSEQAITHPFYVGMADGIKWTSSDNVTIGDDGTVTPLAQGDGWVKASATYNGKTMEKTFSFAVSDITAINCIADGKTCTRTIYYDMSGREVATPSLDGVYVQKRVFDDGTQSVQKVSVKH